MASLAGNQRILVAKAIRKVQQNPLSFQEEGYGKPLGNKHNNDLSGFLKIKLRNEGLCVVYKVVRTGSEMLIIAIGARKDEEVYGIASKRIKKYDL